MKFLQKQSRSSRQEKAGLVRNRETLVMAGSVTIYHLASVQQSHKVEMEL
jgi:hypothetical protein